MDHQDATITFQEAFDAVLDKGALDAVGIASLDALAAATGELARTVREGGVVVSISRALEPSELVGAFPDALWANLRDGGLHVCEMHKRKDAFLLKGRGEDMKFRWCFYCHRPQKIEEFSPSSRSICKEKFALRKQRRKVKSELANKNKHIKEATAPTSLVFDDCSAFDPMSFVMDECLNYDDDCLK